MPSKASDVHLVNDHVLHRPVERLISLPVVVVNVDDNAAHGSRQVVGRPDGIRAVIKSAGITQSIRVDQYLVAVEAKPVSVKILRSVNSVGVVSAGLEAFDIDVPEEERLVGGGLQADSLDGLSVVVRVEEKKFDSSGMPRKDREIHSLLIDGGPEWVGSAWFCL